MGNVSSNHSMNEKPIYHLELEPVGTWPAPPEQRLKALLKRALRTHGLRCRAVKVVDGTNLAQIRGDLK